MYSAFVPHDQSAQTYILMSRPIDGGTFSKNHLNGGAYHGQANGTLKFQSENSIFAHYLHVKLRAPWCFFSTSPKCNSSWRATGLTQVLYESQMHQWETSNCWFLQEHCRLQYCSWVYSWYNFKLYKSFNCVRGDALFVIAMASHPLPIYPQFTRISTLTVLIRNKWNL